MESILRSISKLLGIEDGITHFDSDLIIFINGALLSLSQIGIGPVGGYSILSASDKWIDFLGDRRDIDAVKTCVYLKVKLVFDPPSNSFLVDSIKRLIEEYEWRLSVQVTPVVPTTVEGVTASE
jgi:hypothetical protein